jgi:hypothetical protein
MHRRLEAKGGSGWSRGVSKARNLVSNPARNLPCSSAAHIADSACRRGSVVAILATCGHRRKQLPSWSFALPPMTDVYSPWPTSRVTFVS